MTKTDAAAVAATLVRELKRANARVEGGRKVPASDYRALERKLTRQFQTLGRESSKESAARA